MVKNIVLDIGNVLVDYNVKEFLAAKGYDGVMIKRLIKSTVMSPYWDMFERNLLSEDEVLNSFASLDPEIKDDLFNAFSKIPGMLTIRDYAIPFVKKLKEDGYRVYYLSNYSKKAYDECRDSVAFMEYTDGGLLSFQAGVTKPEEKIYTMFLDKYGLKPEECLFVDDTPVNVEVAEKLGFVGVVFETYEKLLSDLKDILS